MAAVAGVGLTLVGATAPAALPADIDQADVDEATTLLRLGATGPADSGPDIVRPSVEPVPPEPEPALVDADELVRSVQRAEQEVARIAAERQAAEERAATQREAAARERAERAEQAEPPAAGGSPDCELNTGGLGAVKSHVRAAAEFLGCQFGGPTMLGVAGRGGPSDHPAGRAVDFIVDRATGDALADCALRNKESLGITYVIWRQRINHGNGWTAMEDRGDVTANHFDHVHISFGPSGRSDAARGC